MQSGMRERRALPLVVRLPQVIRIPRITGVAGAPASVAAAPSRLSVLRSCASRLIRKIWVRKRPGDNKP